jgi:hypothetical protein
MVEILSAVLSLSHKSQALFSNMHIVHNDEMSNDDGEEKGAHNSEIPQMVYGVRKRKVRGGGEEVFCEY